MSYLFNYSNYFNNFKFYELIILLCSIEYFIKNIINYTFMRGKDSLESSII